jgi:glycosyltransferase involved in cell wall biosynthesis
VVGRPAAQERNGTIEVLRALAHINAHVSVTIKCMRPAYVQNLLRTHNARVPANVRLHIDDSPATNYWDLYAGHDVLLMPRRWGGLCLPIQEALGAGMPVILGSHDVYAAELPDAWAVSSRQTDTLMAHIKVPVHAVNVAGLAHTIDRMAHDVRLAEDGYAAAKAWAQQHSWVALKPLYDKLFG